MLNLGVTNIYLDTLSKYCLKNFVNVIPCDYLSKYELRPGMQFIVNLSDSKSPGSHFVALSFHENHITQETTAHRSTGPDFLISPLHAVFCSVFYSNQVLERQK